MRLGAGAVIVAAVTATVLAVPVGEAGAGGTDPAPAAAAPVAAAPVAAAPVTAAPTTAASGPTDHCVLRAASTGKLAAPVCFDSFRAAIAFATDGRVADAPESASTAAVDPAFAARLDGAVTAGSAVLGLEYVNVNYGGGSLTLSAAYGCDNSSDVDWQFGSLPSGWNDRISSFRSFSNCIQRLYRDVNFGVAITPATASMSWVGSAANDQASSVRFY
jgi:hypothetical protein